MGRSIKNTEDIRIDIKLFDIPVFLFKDYQGHETYSYRIGNGFYMVSKSKEQCILDIEEQLMKILKNRVKMKLKTIK